MHIAGLRWEDCDSDCDSDLVLVIDLDLRLAPQALKAYDECENMEPTNADANLFVEDAGASPCISVHLVHPHVPLCLNQVISPLLPSLCTLTPPSCHPCAL